VESLLLGGDSQGGAWLGKVLLTGGPTGAARVEMLLP
jgi:hypothetical protein